MTTRTEHCDSLSARPAARLPGVLGFVLVGTIWGSSYTFIKLALEGLTPSQVVLARTVLGLVALLAFLAVRGIRLPRAGRVWAHVVVASALGMVVPFLLLAYGQQRTSAAMAGLLIAAMPLFTVAAAGAFIPSERATRRKIIGFLLGFAGVMLILTPWQGNPGTLTGQLAVLGAAASYAAQAVYVRKFLVHYGLPSITLAAAQLLTATALQAMITPALQWQTPQFSWRVVLSILALGVLGTGVAYVLYVQLITDLGATTASSVNYLEAVVGVIASTTLLGEAITSNMLLGTLIVMAGLAVAENRARLDDVRRRITLVLDSELFYSASVLQRFSRDL